MKLPSTSEIRQIASQAGLGEKAVERLLGSVKVRREAGADLELGLCIRQIGDIRTSAARLHQALSTSLQDYQRSCPLVIGWIGRGDFNPDKIPQQITKATIQHACRTRGRVRAMFLRELSSSQAM